LSPADVTAAVLVMVYYNSSVDVFLITLLFRQTIPVSHVDHGTVVLDASALIRIHGNVITCDLLSTSSCFVGRADCVLTHNVTTNLGILVGFL